MSSFVADSVLAEVSADEPCGPDMEYDPVFQEMERAGAGKEEQQMGDSVVAAEPPDWRLVKKNALEISSKSKDIRAAIFLCQAALCTEGWAGFATGLQVVEGMIKQYWDEFHPMLDPDDNNDPTMRVNVIAALSDEDGALGLCHHVPVVEAKGVGSFARRDMDIASGDISLPDNYEGETPNAALIEAAFLQMELEELQAVGDALQLCSTSVDGINTGLAERMSVTETPDLDPLSKLLQQLLGAVNEALLRRGVSVEGAEGEVEAESGKEAAGGISGTVQSREDVVRVLDQICEFYRRSEPSSPVPVLILRARKLVNMDFMDIMRNLTPGGLSEAESLRGPEE